MKKPFSLIRSVNESKSLNIFGFLTFFSVFLPYLFKPLIFYKTLKELSPFLTVSLNILGFFFASIFLYLMLLSIDKKLNENEENSIKLNLKAMVSCILLSFINYLVYGVSLNRMFPYFSTEKFRFTNLTENPNLILYSVASLILLIALIITAVSMVIVTVQKQPAFQITKVLKKAFIFFFRNCFFLLFYGIIFSLLFFMLRFLGVYLLDKQPISALLEYIYKGALTVSLGGFFYILLTKIIFVKIIEKNHEVAIQPSITNNLVPFIFITVVIATGVYLNFQQPSSLLSEVNRAIDKDSRLAEEYANDGQYDLSGYYYKRSYVLSRAMMGYIKTLILEKDSSYSKEMKGKTEQEVETLFSSAYQLNPSSGLYYYLNSLRFKNLNKTSEEITNMEMAASYLSNFPNPLLDLVDLYHKKQEKVKSSEIFNKTVKQGEFVQYSTLQKENLKKLNSLYTQYEEKSKVIYKKFPIAAMFYYENNMYNEALAELNTISKEIPEEPSVNYLLALVDLKMMQDNKSYDVAMKAANKIVEKYPNEKWAIDFKALVASRAGSTEEYQKVLKLSYEKSPEDLDVAEQYAYSIMKNNTGFSLTEMDKTAEEILNKVLQKDKDRWFPYYCKAILELKRLDFAASLDNINRFSNRIINEQSLLPYYDDFYYVYVLKYKTLLTMPEAAKALTHIKDSDPFAYNYIYGAYYWSVKDFEKGKSYLGTCIDINENLSKPHFLLGNVFFEHGFLNKTPQDYPSALAEFNTSLSIFNDDPYCWFALGHLYKNMNRSQDALGAFQKVLYYMPQEDHNQDHFGISIHAKLQVEELQNKLHQ